MEVAFFFSKTRTEVSIINLCHALEISILWINTDFFGHVFNLQVEEQYEKDCDFFSFFWQLSPSSKADQFILL